MTVAVTLGIGLTFEERMGLITELCYQGSAQGLDSVLCELLYNDGSNDMEADIEGKINAINFNNGKLSSAPIIY